MKSQIPDKLEVDGKREPIYFPLAHTINQLIDYLAELTEVVEGKQKFDAEKWYRGEPQNTTTPTLKETLLGEINKQPQFLFMAGRGKTHIRKEDVEAIINRLMP